MTLEDVHAGEGLRWFGGRSSGGSGGVLVYCKMCAKPQLEV